MKDVIVYFALKNKKSVDNYSGKYWLSAKLLNTEGLFLKSAYSLMHRPFSYF